MRFWKGLILLAALDSAVVGGWAAVRPADLFTLFQQPPNDDGLLLCRLLGVLYLFHALFLILAAYRSATFGGLVLVPSLGRLGLCGVWLWLAGVGPNAGGLKRTPRPADARRGMAAGLRRLPLVRPPRPRLTFLTPSARLTLVPAPPGRSISRQHHARQGGRGLKQ